MAVGHRSAGQPLLARPWAVRGQSRLVSRAERAIATDRIRDLGQRVDLQGDPGALLVEPGALGADRQCDTVEGGAGHVMGFPSERSRPAACRRYRRASVCLSGVATPLLAAATAVAAAAFGTGCGSGAQIASGRFPGLRGGSVPSAR